MKKKSNYHVAVVGATGAVGQQIIRLLEEREVSAEPFYKIGRIEKA